MVAIDGPSGSGKSSASRGVASSLGLSYLDTGAMYRALTWWLMSAGVDTADERLVAARAAEPVIEVCTDPDDPWTRVNGSDVSREIRSEAVSAQVSVVARVQAVRDHLIAAQRAIISSAAAGIVAEGRDIGTVVAPHAQLKVFLTADPQARARRRAAEQGAAVRCDRGRPGPPGPARRRAIADGRGRGPARRDRADPGRGNRGDRPAGQGAQRARLHGG